jgi:hypothetical protein
MMMRALQHSQTEARRAGAGCTNGGTASKRLEPSPAQLDVLELDPDGDVILHVEDTDPEDGATTRFLVSSKVLSLASPVFNGMFSPQFSEGIRVRNGEVPCITLGEDDAATMETILRILHFQHDNDSFAGMTRESFASIAIHSDKYDCNKALRAWMRGWWDTNDFGTVSELTSKDIGLTLVAAYLVRFRDLRRIATEALPY